LPMVKFDDDGDFFKEPLESKWFFLCFVLIK
jgi:hypothetical protein